MTAEHGDDTTVAAGGDDAGLGTPYDVGDRIGRYVIVDRVGAGAMGVVFAAYDPSLDRRIALKVVDPQGRPTDALMREAQAMAQLNDPHVVSVHDVGLAGPCVFIAMEFVDGTSLDEWLESRTASMTRSWSFSARPVVVSRPPTRPGSFTATSSRPT